MTPVQRWLDLLSATYGQGKWIVAMDNLAVGAHMAERLRELGAQEVLCVAATLGAGGPEPEALSPAPILLNVRAREMMAAIRAGLDAMANLSEAHCAQIDRFDEAGTARALGAIFDDGRPVGGRAKFGARPRAWQALEDKTVIDALWDAAGVARAPSLIVPFTHQALIDAYHRLNAGDGVVCAIDNARGFHGGASGTRWAPSVAHLREIISHYQDDGVKQARVMPFYEGIPCSIHGIVFPDHVVTLRPCEMLVFRSPSTGIFQYAGSATFWEPSAEDRDALRALAQRVGEHLRATVGYRGAFTIDGVLSADGFIPTELNPRFGAAMGYMAKGIAPLPMDLMNLAIVEGVEADWQPRAFEALMREAADASPAGGMGTVVAKAPRASLNLDLHYDGASWSVAGSEDRVDGKFIYGCNTTGGYLRVSFVTEHTPRGPSLATRALHALEFTRRTFNLSDIASDLVAARAMR